MLACSLLGSRCKIWYEKAIAFYCLPKKKTQKSIFFKISVTHLLMVLIILFHFIIGICADIAPSQHEHWSSLAPLPFEVVTSAGQKAKEESWNKSEYIDTLIFSWDFLSLELAAMEFT